MNAENNPVKIMLDSGAYGAWKRGIELDVGDYINFIKEHEEHLWSYVNMDVIPGVKGSLRKKNYTDVKVSSEASYANQQRMKDAGLSPIPVFHQGEDWKWLERLLKDGEPYIGLSPYLRSHQRVIKEFLDECFTYCTDSKGNPTVKTHGFGVTTPQYLMRYPWHTSDSTTWKMGPAYGFIYIPRYDGKGRADYSKPPMFIHMTGRRTDVRQYAALGPTYKRWVEQFLEEMGLTVPIVRYSVLWRFYCLAKYFKDLEEHCQDITFKHRRRNIDYGLKAINVPLHVIYSTTVTGISANTVLNMANANHRLLSYFDLKNHGAQYLPEYIQTGAVGKFRKPKRDWKNQQYMDFRRLELVKKVKENDLQQIEAAGEVGKGESCSLGVRDDPSYDPLLVYRGEPASL